ncbi:MAG: c-type cytochrome [Paracoccaceae bacterium]
MRLGIVVAMLIAGSAAAHAGGDAAAGEKAFKRCKMCHRVGEGAKNAVGPVLTGVVGRPAASFEGYKYGDSMRAAGEAGLVWDEELIAKYIADPSGFLREYLGDRKAKAKMKFKLKDEQARADVAAYLATFSAAN